MGKEARKSFRINIFCSILVGAFLIGVPIVCIWLGIAHGGEAVSSGELQSDPLRRLPSSPAEAHKRLEKAQVGWPNDLAGAGDRSAGSLEGGIRVSIPYDTVTGRTTHANTGVTVVLTRGANTWTKNTTTDANRYFDADMGDVGGDIQSGDTVSVTDLGGGSTVNIDCTLTCSMDAPNDIVSGTAATGRTIDVYIKAPSTYYGDVPPGVAHLSTTGTPWSIDFTDTLKLRRGDAAFVYSTDSYNNTVMDVTCDGGSLVVYPQYDEVMGYYQPGGQSLTVHAGAASQTVPTANDGFFEAWFTTHDIKPPDLVQCQMGGDTPSIMVSDLSAKCSPATNHVTGTGPANRVIRLTMSPYSNPVIYQVTTDAQGDFDIDLGSRFTATGSEVYNIAWYDSDCDSVVYEFQTFSWHMAEGYTGLTPGGGGFDTYVLLQNPSSIDATVDLTFQVEKGAAPPRSMTVPANSRVTVHLDELPDLADASVSTKATSTNGAPLNAERSVYFNYAGLLGGHDSVGTLTPSDTWYLAEGYTGTTPGGGWFDTWVTVQNPGTVDAHVKMQFQLDQGTAPDLNFVLPAGTRKSYKLNDLPGVAGISVSTKVTADQPIVVERPMYFSYEGKMGGHDSIGVNVPQKTWYMAEGYTGLTPGGGGFDTWVCIQNPNTQDAHVTLSFQLSKGTQPDYKLTVRGQSRQSVHLDAIPGLEDASVSTKVTSDVPVVAERPIYFSYEGRRGGHDSKAAESPSRGWYLPEGYTGLTPYGGKFDTWVCVQNPGSTTAHVTLKFQLESGTAPDYVFDLPAGTRQSIHLNTLPVLSSGINVSTTVISDQEVVAERPIYFIYYGIDGGTDSVGIPFTP